MLWKNPLNSLSRTLAGKKVAKCMQCGSCCPKTCRHLEFSTKGIANCKANNKVQKGELGTCIDPPERQYKLWHPLIRGNRENGKMVFNCRAVQGIIDNIFGKGMFQTQLEPGNRRRNWIAFRIAEKLPEVLNAKTREEFENAKKHIRLVLEEMQERQ